MASIEKQLQELLSELNFAGHLLDIFDGKNDKKLKLYANMCFTFCAEYAVELTDLLTITAIQIHTSFTLSFTPYGK